MKWVQDRPSEIETISQSRAKAIVLDQESAASGEMFGLLAGARRRMIPEEVMLARPVDTQRRCCMRLSAADVKRVTLGDFFLGVYFTSTRDLLALATLAPTPRAGFRQVTA
jgi:hypothetical protein